MIDILERRSWRPMDKMLIPSMDMQPFQGSTKRKRLEMMEDFPAPVLPTTPTF